MLIGLSSTKKPGPSCTWQINLYLADFVPNQYILSSGFTDFFNGQSYLLFEQLGPGGLNVQHVSGSLKSAIFILKSINFFEFSWNGKLLITLQISPRGKKLVVCILYKYFNVLLQELSFSKYVHMLCLKAQLSLYELTLIFSTIQDCRVLGYGVIY